MIHQYSHLSFVIKLLTTSGFNNEVSTSLTPRNLSGIAFGRDSDFLAVDNELTILVFNGTLEATMNGVILEHVDHVVERNERVVDSNNLDVIAFQGSTKDNTTNTTETIESISKIWIGAIALLTR